MRIKILQKNRLDFRDTTWFQNTRINYGYKNRNLFIRKRNDIIVNPYVPMDSEFQEYNRKLNAMYLFLNVEDNGDFIDYDFDIGFNNAERSLEHSLVWRLGEGKELYCILCPSRTTRVPHFDLKVDQYIRSVCDVVVNTRTESPVYIVRVTNNVTLQKIHTYIRLYFYVEKSEALLELTKKDLIDMQGIKMMYSLSSLSDFIMMRSSYFANYNLCLYSLGDLSRQLNLIRNYFQNENIECVSNL